eukprot:366123-Chlamydomonas_euryale.AAC.4
MAVHTYAPPTRTHTQVHMHANNVGFVLHVHTPRVGLWLHLGHRALLCQLVHVDMQRACVTADVLVHEWLCVGWLVVFVVAVAAVAHDIDHDIRVEGLRAQRLQLN